jgi:hypothetical protein
VGLVDYLIIPLLLVIKMGLSKKGKKNPKVVAYYKRLAKEAKDNKAAKVIKRFPNL